MAAGEAERIDRLERQVRLLLRAIDAMAPGRPDRGAAYNPMDPIRGVREELHWLWQESITAATPRTTTKEGGDGGD